MPIVIILALYLGLAYLTNATEGFYVYNFLNLQTNSHGKVAGYIIGILIGSVIVFLIVRYVIVLRVWITEKKMGKTGNFKTRHGVAARDEASEKPLPTHTFSAK